MKKILCVGGCVIDILVISENIPIINHNNKKFLGIEYGSKTPGLKFIINEGGSATNLALNLKCLGLNSALLATIGDDFMGNFIYNSIQASGLDYRGLIQLPNTNTGIAFIVKSSNHNDRGMITIKGASDLLSKSLINKEFINDYDWLAWCSLTSESALNTINELIKIFKTRKNGLIIAAPSSSMIKKYPRKTFEMVMNSNILASNLEEAKILLDIDDLSWVETAKSFLNLGLSFISITNGENGAIIGNKNELIKINRKLKITIIYVTHEPVEIKDIVNRIVMLKEGKIIGGAFYLPLNLRKEIILKVRKVCQKYQIPFASCREGFLDLSTAPSCDGSWLIQHAGDKIKE